MALPKVIHMDDHRPAGPQLEDGYVRIANELFDALLAKLSSYRHLKVALAILRKTYGYQKKEDDITISQLAEITGIHRNHVGVTVRELEAMRVIRPVRAGAYGLMIGINKHHAEWLADEVKPRGERKPSTELVDSADSNQTGCAKQPNQLIDATKTVDGSNQNVAHKRQPQKTTPKDNPKRTRSADRDGFDVGAAFDQFWSAYAYKKDRPNAERAFAKLFATADDKPSLLARILAAAAIEAQRRPHLIADGRTPIYAQGWLNGGRFDDEDLQTWGRFTVAQQAFVEAFNANIGDTCPSIDEWTEKRAALIDIALGGKWTLDKWAEFWRFVRDDCEFRWPVSLEWMLERENFAKVKAGQYSRSDA